MNRTVLRWFYVGVQSMFMVVSIPNVASFFGAYDTHGNGPAINVLGLAFTVGDVKHLGVGVAIDLGVALTGLAAIERYAATRKSSGLIPHFVIMSILASISVIANYEDTAAIAPPQYAHVRFFDVIPALLVNPLVASMVPLLGVMFVVLVPSILAQPRVQTAAEIDAETEDTVARIQAKARIETAKAQAGAQVWGARGKGLVTAARQVVAAPKDGSEPPVTDRSSPGVYPVETATQSGPLSAGKAGETRGRGAARQAGPSGMMSSPQLRTYLAERGVFIPSDRAAVYVHGLRDSSKIGTAYWARRDRVIALANRLIQEAQASANAAEEQGALVG